MNPWTIRRGAALLGAVCVFTLATVGCGSNDGGGGTSGDDAAGVTDDSVALGVIYDATGPTAATQTPGYHGFDAYVQKVNKDGGINGRQLEVKTCDEKYTAEAGLQCLKRFDTQDPVFALANSLNGGTFQVAAEPVVARSGIPVVGPQSAQKEVLLAGNPYLYFLQCDYADMADVAIPYAEEVTKAAQPRVSTVVLPVPGGIDWSTLLEARVKDAGGDYLGTHELEPTATQADAIAQQIANQNPDWVGFHGGVANAVVLLKSLAKFDVDVPVIGISQIGVHETWESVPESVGSNFASIGCFTSGDIKVEGTADMAAVAQAAGYGKEVSNVAFVQGYVTGMVVAAAIEEAGDDLTRSKFTKALDGMTDFSTGGLSANVSFGPEKRTGVTITRPSTFDYGTGKITARGEYSDWEQYVTHENQPKSLER